MFARKTVVVLASILSVAPIFGLIVATLAHVLADAFLEGIGNVVAQGLLDEQAANAEPPAPQVDSVLLVIYLDAQLFWDC